MTEETNEEEEDSESEKPTKKTSDGMAKKRKLLLREETDHYVDTLSYMHEVQLRVDDLRNKNNPTKSEIDGLLNLCEEYVSNNIPTCEDFLERHEEVAKRYDTKRRKK